jgi:hypothetical protein
MATTRKHRKKWEVQVRRLGIGSVSKSFHTQRDAEGVCEKHGGEGRPP